MLIYKCLIFFLPLLFIVAISYAQGRTDDRPPAVAGLFYPGQAEELGRVLTDLFAKAVGHNDLKDVAAIIVPHAGYAYSGEVAASGFNQLDPEKVYDNIFILGPSHKVGFEGAAVYSAGNFLTPLGRVEVNRELGKALAEKSPAFSTRTDAHALEHSVEVQLPFLQQHLHRPFRIVPIVLGANKPETCRQIAEALLPYMKGENLFVISTDFSHYPAYEDAVRVDKAVADSIASNSPDALIKTMRSFEHSGIKNLATPLCGFSGVMTLLYMTSAAGGDIAYHPIQYKNSGDVAIGDKERVVGYHAIAVTRQLQVAATAFELSPEDKKTLLALARHTVERYVRSGSQAEVEPGLITDTLKTRGGAFVTLKKRGQLRGCIGRFEATDPLYQVVRDMAIASASQDYRFKPVSEDEIKDLKIEISVLTPMRQINSIDEFELYRHGIYIRQGLRSGTFLPQVARETGWTKEELFGHCAQDKADIGWDGWKNAELFVYEALIFGEQ